MVICTRVHEAVAPPFAFVLLLLFVNLSRCAERAQQVRARPFAAPRTQAAEVMRICTCACICIRTCICAFICERAVGVQCARTNSEFGAARLCAGRGGGSSMTVHWHWPLRHVTVGSPPCPPGALARLSVDAPKCAPINDLAAHVFCGCCMFPLRMHAYGSIGRRLVARAASVPALARSR